MEYIPSKFELNDEKLPNKSDKVPISYPYLDDNDNFSTDDEEFLYPEEQDFEETDDDDESDDKWGGVGVIGIPFSPISPLPSFA